MARKQQKIPETVEPDIEELDDIAEALSEANDQKITWQNEWSELRARMAAAMERHDRKLYEHSGVRYELEEGKIRLKMKTLKDDDE